MNQTVYYNGIIYTGEERFCEAFLVQDGAFAAVGENAEVLKLSDPDSARIDLGGRFVCPGFNDSHMHVLSYGRSLRTAQLAGHTESLQEMLQYMQEYARYNPPSENGWLIGRGWNQDYFTDTDRMPDRNDLDAISTAYPILLIRTCGHACVVNTKGLQVAGINRDTPSPEGGAIGLENGEPDGRLYDNAIELLSPFIPAPDKEELKDMIRRACKELNRYGVTSVQTDDYGVFPGVSYETVNEAFRELLQEGNLSVRVYEQANFGSLEGLRDFVEAGNVTGVGDDHFRIGPLKLVADGSLGSRTAHLSRPYADMPETSGFSLFSPAELQKLISYANAHDMQIAVHAIGDACLDEVLNAVEQALTEHPREDHRHGIVHCQITRPDQLKRIAALGMHVYAQTVFLDYDNHIVEKRAGSEFSRSSYCFRTLMEKGVSVSNGSDCPVELPDVMRGVECAVTRTSLDGTGPYLPEEAFTVREALDSYTIQSAKASFEEDRKGRIAPGYFADFTVLERNPFETEKRDLHRIEVQACFLDGKCVYRA